MPFRMKALKTFMDVRAGQEFDAGNQTRAQELETRGLAIPLDKAGKESPSKRRTPNKAAAGGPLSSTGGQTGVVKGPSSSRAGRARPAKRKSSRKSGGKKGGAGK